jgi:ketosteroid isomerase-like protein
MRTKPAFLCLSILLAAISVTALAGDEAEVIQTLQDYEAAWSRHDANAIASFYYEPAMRIGRGGPVVRPLRSDQETFFSGFMPELIRRGFDHSGFEELNVHLLDTDTAIASGILLRYRKEGDVLERAAVSFGLRKTTDGWKIFLTDTHAPDTVMRFR